MSVSEHDAVARHEMEVAAEHKAKYDPDAGSTGTGGCMAYCFSTWSNPTTMHAQEARKHRARAAKHRRASQALRDAEANSCIGIAERDRDVSPFFHLSDIATVTVPAAGEELEAPRVRFSRVPGVDLQGMQRLVDCHSARNAALGNEVPEMAYCPLVPRGVRARVEQVGESLEVILETEETEETEARAAVTARALSLKAQLAEYRASPAGSAR